MPKFQTPRVPFVEAHYMGGKQKPTAIAINLSMTTSQKGAALGIATRLHKRNSPPTSHHYVVDEASIYRGVWDNRAAYGSLHRTLNILVCAEAVEDVRLWDHAGHSAVLHRTAELVADLILAFKIEPHYLEGDDLDRWKKRRSRRRGGIIVRVPGAWPYEHFLTDVKSQLIIKTS